MKQARHNASLVVGCPPQLLWLMQYLNTLGFYVRFGGRRDPVPQQRRTLTDKVACGPRTSRATIGFARAWWRWHTVWERQRTAPLIGNGHGSLRGAWGPWPPARPRHRQPHDRRRGHHRGLSRPQPGRQRHRPPPPTPTWTASPPTTPSRWTCRRGARPPRRRLWCRRRRGCTDACSRPQTWRVGIASRASTRARAWCPRPTLTSLPSSTRTTITSATGPGPSRPHLHPRPCPRPPPPSPPPPPAPLRHMLAANVIAA
jgi:hypothetical protein